MWSSVAAVLAFVGVTAGFMVGEDEEPLALTPRGARLTAISAVALLSASALALIGLASWRWTGTAAGWSAVLGTGRLLFGWPKRADDFALERDSSDAPLGDPPVKPPPEPHPDVWQNLPRGF
jgi:hypothetical protein